MTPTQPARTPPHEPARSELRAGRRCTVRFVKPCLPVEKEKVQGIVEAARLQSQHARPSLIARPLSSWGNSMPRDPRSSRAWSRPA